MIQYLFEYIYSPKPYLDGTLSSALRLKSHISLIKTLFDKVELKYNIENDNTFIIKDYEGNIDTYDFNVYDFTVRNYSPYSINFYKKYRKEKKFKRINIKHWYEHYFKNFGIYSEIIKITDNNSIIIIHLPTYDNYVINTAYYLDRKENTDIIQYSIDTHKRISIFDIVCTINDPFWIMRGSDKNKILKNMNIHMHRMLYILFLCDNYLSKYIVDDINVYIKNIVKILYYPCYFV
jgi:hypothetical protein